jgi:hypothetical protein
MFFIAGITGNIGGAAAKMLLVGGDLEKSERAPGD